MLCKRCMVVMGTGTRYEQRKGQERPLYKRYYECGKCHDRVYANIPNFKDLLVKESGKSGRK